MRLILLACALAGALAGQSVPVRAVSTTAEQPRVGRAVLEKIEKTLDQSVAATIANDPFELLGGTRAIYLKGYGAVLTAELNLVITPVTPFHPRPDKNGIAKLREKKLQRYEILKKAMRQMLVESAASLDAVPPDEQVALGMWLLYRNFEDRTGLPSRVLMAAPRQKLLDFKANRIDEQALLAAMRVEEY
jgi:hypothetical protein